MTEPTPDWSVPPPLPPADEPVREPLAEQLLTPAERDAECAAFAGLIAFITTHKDPDTQVELASPDAFAAALT